MAAPQLVKSGRTVIAAARSADKAAEVFGERGLVEGFQDPAARSGGILLTAPGVDVTDASSLSAELFQGVTQVVTALGGVAGRLPDGTFGYLPDQGPEKVEAAGEAGPAGRPPEAGALPGHVGGGISGPAIPQPGCVARTAVVERGSVGSATSCVA